MNFKSELDNLFYNYSHETDWVVLSGAIVKVIRKYSGRKVNSVLVYRSLSFCDKNSMSFLKTLVGKLIRVDGNEAGVLLNFFKAYYPEFMSDSLN